MRILDGLLSLLRRLSGQFVASRNDSTIGFRRVRSSSSAREEIFPGLFVRELEQRRVLSASNMAVEALGRTLVINAGLQAGNAPEIFEATRQGDTLQISANGGMTATAQLEQISTIKLEAANDQDTFIFSLGAATTFAVPPDGLTIQAGANSTVEFTGATNLQGGSLTVAAGTIRVDGSLISHGGKIDLDAGANGMLLVSGAIDVSNTASGQTGGSVELLGNRVGLLGSAQIDASGDSGGGTVLIGGDYHGANAEILNASYVYVGPGVQISADAITQGDGGHVVVWSEVATQFLGSISARGGSSGGNGGLIETSGKQYLEVGDGSITAAAANGHAGMWLLDPEDVTISSATMGGTFSGGNPDVFTPTSDSATVDAAAIDTSLNAGTSVTITTGSTGSQNGDITVATEILCSAAPAGTPTLLLQAAGDINVNAPISGSAGVALNVNLEAGGNVTVASPITTYGGTFTSSGLAFDNAGGAVSTAGGAATLNHTGGITVGSPIDTAAGSISLTGSSISGSGVLTAGGLSTSTSAASGNQSLTVVGTVSVTELNAGTGTIALNAGTFRLSGNVVNAASALDLNGATLDLNANSISVAALSGAGGTITDSNLLHGISTVTVDQSSATSFSGTLADGSKRQLALVMSGSGSLTLASSDDYSGGTTINSGSVILDNATALGSGRLAVNGGTLDLNGNSITVAALSGTGGTITDNNLLHGISTVTVVQPNTTSFSGMLADGSKRQLAIIMAGNGSLTLENSDDYSGGTTINSGSVVLGNATALGSGRLTVNGGTLDLNANSISVASLSGTGGTITDNNASSGISTLTDGQPNTTTFSGMLLDGSMRQLAFVMAGSGSLTLAGSNSYSGGTGLSDGTVVLGSGGAIGSVGNITFAGGTLQFTAAKTNDYSTRIKSSTAAISLDTNGQNVTMAGVIDNSNIGGLTKLGDGTLLLSGVNSYSGIATVTTGTLQLGNANALGDSGLAMNGGTLDLNANSITVASLSGTAGTITDNNAAPGISTLTVDQPNTTTFSGTVSDGSVRQVALVMAGSGSLTLASGNSYSGGTTIDSGSVVLGNAAALGSGGLAVNGGTLDLNANSITVASLSGTGGTITDNNATPGISTLTDDQPNTTTFSGTLSDGSMRQVALVMAGSGSLTLTGSNSYSGGTTLNNGTLVLGSSGAIGALGNITFAGGTLEFTAANTNDYSTRIMSSTAAISLDTNGQNVTMAGVIDSSNTAGLTKLGDGTLLLAGNNSYSGISTVITGTLQLGNANGLGPSADGTVVDAGAVLDLNGQSVGNEAVTINGTGIADNGALINSSTSAASLSGPVSLAGDSAISNNGDLALTGGVSGGFALTLLGPGNLNSAASPLTSTVSAIVDDKSGGSAFISQSAAGLNLSGTMTNGSNLDLTDAGTTTLVGPLNAGTGNVTLSGAVAGGTNVLAADIFTLDGGGEIGDSGNPLDTNVNSLVLNKTSGDSFLSQDQATPLTLSGATAGNLTLTAGDTTIASPGFAATGGLLTVNSLAINARIDMGAGSLIANGAVNFNVSGGPLVPAVKTGGDQTYVGAATLEADTALTSGNNITFYSTVDSIGSPSSLTLTTAGNITFNGNIGSGSALGDFVVTQANQVVFGGASVRGPGPQSEGPVSAIDTVGNIDIGQASTVGGIVFNAGPGAAYTLSLDNGGRNITLNGPVTLDSSLTVGQPAVQSGTVNFASTILSQGTDYNNLGVYAGTVNFHGNVGRLVPDPVGNPNPNLALGTATIEVSGAINIDPGVELRVWHENFGIPGGVSQITPVLILGPKNPPIASPANPTQTVTGSFGLAPNYTEYGQNFTIIVKWDESFRTDISVPPVITTFAFDPAEFAKSNLNAGGTLNLFVNADGSINWSASSLNPGTGSGVVNFTITRTYPLSYLTTVSQGLHASVTIVTDQSLNFTIRGVRMTGTTAEAPVTTFAAAHHVGIEFTAQEAPPIEIQAYEVPIAQVVNSTQITPANSLSGDQPVREEVKKVVRHFLIVKVDVEGKEGNPNPLPDDTLEQMPTLLKRFIKSLPNGRYRIYLVEGVEGGEQTTRLLREFYKSGKSLGDPVHEIGPGSIEGEAPAAPAGNPVHGNPGGPGPAGPTAPAGKSVTPGKTSQHAPGPADQPPSRSSRGLNSDGGRYMVPAGGVRHRAVQSAMLALGTLATRHDWKQRVDAALENGAGRSFRRAARVLRQGSRHRAPCTHGRRAVRPAVSAADDCDSFIPKPEASGGWHADQPPSRTSRGLNSDGGRYTVPGACYLGGESP
jgi:autotransporter-associated beta strand protein